VKRPARLDDTVVDEWLKKHPLWRREGGHLLREVTTRDYPSAVALLSAQVPLAERIDHHPVATLGYCELRLDLWTHDRAGLTQLDLDYAQGFDEVADAFSRWIVS
jgi:4a-hydroxytetrahydrobiopterin dehydratase